MLLGLLSRMNTPSKAGGSPTVACGVPNTTVQVYDDIFRTSQVFLIDHVTLTKDNSGTKSKLHLIHPEALLNTDVPDLPKKTSTSSNASYQFTHKGETGEAQWTK